ncbi:hypothetical protein OS493_006584 [Desmophyllum pertusum]|uniref:Chordin n=1 Tax=Desmophyllum pertusum TaxID=174260 RepID=A0A9X0DD30_9CNID|nr:hypothetical protein OS493_006584 [Desmophyllum pertusum]
MPVLKVALIKQSFENVSRYHDLIILNDDIVLLNKPLQVLYRRALKHCLSSDDETSSALASFNLVKSGKLLRIYLRYNGSHTLGSETQVTIKLIKNPTNNKDSRVVKEISAPQVKRENSNFKTIWLDPSEHALKWMSRGHLNITMILKTANQTTELTGRVNIKRTCNTIVSQLSGRDAPRPTMTGASGYASFEFFNTGQIHYQVFLSGLKNPVLEISLQATNRRQNIKRLSRSVTSDAHGRVKVSGVWERPSFTEINWLFSGHMFINVRTTANKNGEIHGQLKQFPYRGHHLSYHDPPVLLSGNEVVPSIQTGAAGQAWFSLDKNCAFHYHLMLSGMDRGRKNLMTAELQGFADYGEVPQPYDEHVHFLRSFEGETVSGFARSLDSVFLSNLVRGLVYLQVSSEEAPQGELRSQVLVNSDICRRRFPHLQQGGPMHGSCFLGHQEYANGQNWISEDDKCSSCTCQDTEIVCSPLKCQRLNCTEAPILLPSFMLPGLSSRGKKCCYILRKEESAIPFGYMKCHACTCLEKTEDISCTKVTCPDLRCKNPIKLRMTDCCMRCPDNDSDDAGQSDDGKTNKKDVIFVECENGKANCKRDPCPKGQCRNSIDAAMKSCCVPCSGS